MKTPHKCPLCEGKGKCGPGAAVSDGACLACSGTGIVWGDDGNGASVPVIYPWGPFQPYNPYNPYNPCIPTVFPQVWCVGFGAETFSVGHTAQTK